MKKMEILKIICLYLLTFIHLSYNTELKTDVRCLLNDSECLTTQAQRTLQKIIKGIPELGIKPINLLLLDNIKLIVPNYTYEWSDIKVTGLENAVIDNVSIDMNFKMMRVLFHTTLVLDVYYAGEGVVFSVLDTFGEGNANITLRNMYMEILFVFDIIKDKNGKDYIDLKTYYYGFNTLDGVEYYFDNLYNGDKKRGNIVNDLINQNWRTTMGNFGGFFNRKMTDKIFDFVKIYMRSRPLQDFALQ